MKLKIVSSILLITYATPAFSKTDIQFWHGLSGQAADVISDITNEFNKSQKEYNVIAVRKGNYQETMIAGIAAFRAKKQPDIIQIYEVGTATMISAKGATIPITKLMTDNKIDFNKNDIILPVRSYYSSGNQLLSFPFNSSAPIMYYNKKMFKKAGLDINKPPKTWNDVFQFAEKIKKSDPTKCGFTTTWPAWIQLENFGAWHNISYASQSNGMTGSAPNLNFNSQTQIMHWENIQKANKSGYFTYFGRTTEAELSFTTEKCGIILDSTGSYGKVKEAKIDFAVSALPYYENVSGAPQNAIIGGASLWVFNGIKPEKQKGAATFISFLSKPEIMSKWHQLSGYLPVTQGSFNYSKNQGFYDKNPGFTIAMSELTNKNPTENSKGLRIIGLPNIRNIVEANFESMLSGKMTAQKALDDAVEKGNAIIKKSGG
ncbi:sn-glycerol-3-phosphate ABC transporter substrate-binding protein UgpB [Fluviispira multicolorata]|nr:sn-glycerol-3-phosphate ABC transporter substrate-binding protein UgpB [Fluviispira multicolorata]